jgi:hypothetical protein
MQAPPPRKVSGPPWSTPWTTAAERHRAGHRSLLLFTLRATALLPVSPPPAAVRRCVQRLFSDKLPEQFSRKLEFGSWICAGSSGRSSSAKPQVCFSECECQHWVRTRILSITTRVQDCGSAANSGSFIVSVETKSARLLLSLISRSSVLAGIYRSLASRVSRDRNPPASIHISTSLY